MLSKNKKQKVIKKYQTHSDDTGSSEVQIAILTAEIEDLSAHLKKHHKDHSSRRGLLRKVGERRRLLRYLKKEDAKACEDLAKKLKLKQVKVLDKASEAIIDEDSTQEDEISEPEDNV